MRPIDVRVAALRETVVEMMLAYTDLIRQQQSDVLESERARFLDTAEHQDAQNKKIIALLNDFAVMHQDVVAMCQELDKHITALAAEVAALRREREAQQ